MVESGNNPIWLRPQSNSTNYTEIDTYATMVNRRILVPSGTTPYFAVEQHFFFDLMERILGYIEVDEEWYLAQHKDVTEAVRKGLVKSGRNHYMRFGFYEHRLPFRIHVLEDWYLKSYPDVKEALDNQIYRNAQSHFEIAGFREGRLPFPNFSLCASTSSTGDSAPTARRPPGGAG